MVLGKKVKTPLDEYIRSLHPVVLDTENKFLFSGIRKCCLHSVYRHTLKHRAITQRDCRILFNHRMNITNLDDIFKFTIVRNPWDRMVSTFHFLQNWRNRIPKKETFKYYVKTVFKHYGTRCDPHFEHQHPHFYFEGKIFLDFVARYENLKEDWVEIAKAINCDPVLAHKNRSKHKDYRTYYDLECAEIVENIYKTDIDLLGYKFG